MSTRSALIAGASGLIGGQCLRFLLDNAMYGKVTALVRRPLPVSHAKLEQHVVDFDRLKSFSHVIRADDVFCCLGTTRKKSGSREGYEKIDYTYPFEMAKIASGNGARQFLIVSSVGANPLSSVLYLRIKGKVEEAIKNLPFRSVHIFRPSMLVGKRKEFRWEDYVVPPLLKLAGLGMVGKLRKYRAIEGKTVAFSMVEIARMDLEGVYVYESDEIQSIYDQRVK
jgi:uncharacterized protein YbjT (DUF2867 family)